MLLAAVIAFFAAMGAERGAASSKSKQSSPASTSVTSDDSGVFDSCLQNAGAKFMVTFSKAGDFKYHCQIHAQMLGDVKVS